MRKFSSALSERKPFSGSVRPASAKFFSIKSVRDSEVDHLLFGTSQIKNNNLSKPLTLTVRRPQSSAAQFYDCTPHRQIVQVISQDNIRPLNVENNKAKEYSLRLKGSEYKRLLNYSTNTMDYKEKNRAAMHQKEMDSIARRLEFIQLDKLRITREPRTDIQKQDRVKSEILLKKALEDRVDNEAEVRELSNMIKNAKIQSIRDKQIKEKEKLKKLRKEEEMRLNAIVEKESAASFKKQQILDKERLIKEYIGAHTMIQQIEENKQKRINELEIMATENLESKQRTNQLIVDHMMKQHTLKLQQRRKQDEFVIANKTTQERKLIEKEEEKLLDEKIMKIQMEKANKEKSEEEEALKKKLKKDIEFAKMRDVQERYQDLQMEKDELLERRANEVLLRKWRERELEEEIKKKQVAEELQIVNAIQKHSAIVRKAKEAVIERDIFHKQYQKEKLLLEKDKLEEETKQNKKHIYAKALAHQIEQNKKQAVVDKYRLKLEEARIDNDNEIRQTRIREAKLRKLEELRLTGIDKKYLLEIEKYINNPITFSRH